MFIGKRLVNTWWSEVDVSKKEPGILGDMINSREGTEKHNMNLEYLVVPESKEVLKKWWGKSKGHRSQLREFPVAKSRMLCVYMIRPEFNSKCYQIMYLKKNTFYWN